MPFVINTNRALNCFDLVHLDVWGPCSLPSIHGFKYFLTSVDDHSRYTWKNLLKGKFEVKGRVVEFFNMVANKFLREVKAIRSDNDTEFNIVDVCRERGIVHQLSCVETPKQNAQVERKHQHILSLARALMLQASLPKFLWSYAIQHAIYLINCMPFVVLNCSSPFQLLHGTLLDLDNIRVFGCLCYTSTNSVGRGKFDARARKCVFLGYMMHMKGAVVYDVHTRQIVISKNVVFHEHIFPYKCPSPVTDAHCWDTSHDTTSNLPPSTNPSIRTPHTNIPESLTSPDSTPNISPTSPPNSTLTPQPPHPRHSTKITRPPSCLNDYICNYTSSISLPKYSIHAYVSYASLSPPHLAYTMSLNSIPEPTSFCEASKHECWVEAMQRELDALENNKTWLIVDKPHGITPIVCKWVYKVMRKVDGSLERYKARLVAKGYIQTEGIDYFDTFSPIAKMTTVRTLIALASIKGWHIHQLGVNNAFLHGQLQEEVYMTIPQGIKTSSPNKVCKLLKSLYGLKQASRKWYEQLTTLLLGLGFKQAHSDHSLFTHITQSSYVALLIYVDDIVSGGDCLSQLQQIKTVFDHNFGIKDLGKLKFFLGLEAAHSPRGIYLCQRQYCLNLIIDTGVLAGKPVSTPMEPESHLCQDDGAVFTDVESYRRLVGRLLYLTTTRLDITFAVQQLSQFLSKPTVVHFKAAQRILHFLKGSPGQGLFFGRCSSLDLQGYTDSDWAGCPDSQRSISGYYFFIGEYLIAWRSKKQQQWPVLVQKQSTGHLPLPLVSCSGFNSFLMI